VLAIFVGYFVVWSVTPALHTPLMSVTNAISSVIVVGALIAVSVSTAIKPDNIVIAVDRNEQVYYNGAPINQNELIRKFDLASHEAASNTRIEAAWTSKGLGFFALILASVNIFGGFLVTARMLAMYKKKEN
jgi:H+-translocating NAD(P) transhydrogenase subunit alpha